MEEIETQEFKKYLKGQKDSKWQAPVCGQFLQFSPIFENSEVSAFWVEMCLLLQASLLCC